MKSTVVGFAHRSLPFVGLLAIGLVIGSAGCRKKAPSAADTATPAKTPASSTPAKPPEDKVVATVNGTSIMESQVQRNIDERYRAVLAKSAAQAPELAAQQRRQFRETVIDALVMEQLLSEEAKKANIAEVTDQELTAEMSKRLATMSPPMTVEQYQKALEAQGYNYEVMRKGYAQNLRYERLFESKFPGAFNTTEAEAKKYYDENVKEFQVAEQVRASHILIRPADPNTDPNQAKVQAKHKAEELLKKVKGGADFAAVAKESSEDPTTKGQGGDLGLFPRGPMYKSFEDAAFNLKVGQVSDLVETPFGYHIIKLTERHDPNQITFEKAKIDIINGLTRQKREEAIRKYIESLRQNAKIVYPSSLVTPTPQASRPIIVTPADANTKK